MLRSVIIYACAVLLGAALMSFEIVASRYLTPYFGSGINTWASLIALVLFGMTIGYFLGGMLIDRFPTLRLAALFAAVAGLWFAAIPSVSDVFLRSIMLAFESEVWGVLLASSFLLFVPIVCLGTYSPIAVRLMIRRVETSGETAGFIYGISTFGNILGTLGTALVLIPVMGSQDITYLLCGVVLFCALLLYLDSAVERRAARAGR
jgi:hypothetical protein